MNPATVRLGYAIGSGDPVEIPIRNMCVAGQTQEAGKTTALEGLIARAGVRAVTFVTKRGEGSFRGARRIGPYFREQADWEFVASILEASRGEKLKFERPWIIRASRGASTLRDVHENVKRALADPKVRGMSADVYLVLNAYLEVVVPAIAKVAWSPRLELAAGVNAMDLTALPGELQHLVIKSALDWVLEHEQDTIVVIPEAWKFVPEGRGTPVKRAADSLIRQGSGLRDYVWLDSQDLGGVSKTILRHCPVWLLGVQREANEIKRTLANIPASIAKPKPADVATLGLGEFLACFGSTVIKTYAQPAWVSQEIATAIALGFHEAGDAFDLMAEEEGGDVSYQQEFERAKGELEQLRSENARLTERADAFEKQIWERDQAMDGLRTELASLRKELEIRRGAPGRDPHTETETERDVAGLAWI